MTRGSHDGIEQELAEIKQLMDSLSACMDKTAKSYYYRKLVEAGKIIDDVGLLDSYDTTRLYLVLEENKSFIENKSAKYYHLKERNDERGEGKIDGLRKANAATS